MVEVALEACLTDVIERLGVDPVKEPARATAIVADLLGSSTLATGPTVVSLRAVLDELSAEGTNGQIVASEVVEAAVLCGAARDESASTTQVVAKVLQLSLLPEAATPSPQAVTMPPTPPTPQSMANAPTEASNRQGLTVVLVVLMIAAAGGLVGVQLLSNDPETTTVGGNDASVTVSTEATATTVPDASESTTPQDDPPESVVEIPQSSPTGFTVTFPAIDEGAFLVDRGWRITPSQDELIGVIRLSAPGTATASGLHQELVPFIAGDGAQLVWSPEPATAVNRVARFSATLEPGQVLEIEFRTPIISTADLTEADLLLWSDEWATELEQLNALGESNERLEPVIEAVEG